MTICKSQRLKLSRGLIRLSWDKLNLYMLAKKRAGEIDTTGPREVRRTTFQQQWIAKRETRAYHDADITEKQVYKLIPRNLPTAGFGGNIEPSALMYAKLERRVDFIVFRSHFAHSIWAARQLVLDGHVSLNGKRFRYPSHLVKDGDVISVNPKAILTLHKPKPKKGSVSNSKSNEPVKAEAKNEAETEAAAKAEADFEADFEAEIEAQLEAELRAEVEGKLGVGSEAELNAEAEAETAQEQKNENQNENEDERETKIKKHPKIHAYTKLKTIADMATEEKKGYRFSTEYDFVPVPYQQPWMFLPDYLEVNYNICSTVFLREPTITKFNSELPSPFPPQLHSLAFLFYSKRGRY